MADNSFQQECLRQFTDYFTQLKQGVVDNDLKNRLQGFINAGEFLHIISREESTALMEQAHQSVFNMSSQARKHKKSLIHSVRNDENSDFFNIPAIQRKLD